MSVEVHVDWHGRTHRVGTLHSADRGSAVTFEYGADWLASPGAFAVDPTNLPLRRGPHHAAELFGVFQDCGPDRWGRVLIERAVRRQVLGSKPYREMDYVLALADSSRIGALRFRSDPEGPFLAPGDGRIPPLVQLAALINAADAVHSETETARDLRFLLGSGSPIGGARPKSVVALPDGRLAIAKFPKPDDTRDMAAGEILAMALAAKAGIRVAEHRWIHSKGRSVSLISRFDRDGGRRIPFLSANTLLGLSPGDPGAYTQIADGIRQFGEDVRGDLHELWRRLVFSLLASNYDDHLRNHGFLMKSPGKWSLSPAYDLNPVPEIDRARTPKTALSEQHDTPSIEAVLEVASRFGLRGPEAKTILREVAAAVVNWRKHARQLRIPAGSMAAYSTAFEHGLSDEAVRLGS